MSSTIVGAMPPPPGVVPDFSLTRTTVQEKFIVVYSVTLAIAIVFLLLRLYTRGVIVHGFGADDCTCVRSVCRYLLTRPGAVVSSAVRYSFHSGRSI